MTYDSRSPAKVPAVGGFYDLRAGLRCFVNGHTEFYGVKFWKGVLLPPGAGTVLWYANGQYSPVRGNHHELDIIRETSY